MTRPELPATATKTERRVQAVLALFQGEAVADVCDRCGRGNVVYQAVESLSGFGAQPTWKEL